MTIQQLEYIIAVDNHRHFARAAEACYVTQPTLSMMIQKLEDELGVKIFDRSTHPVEPTQVGLIVLEQARAAIRSFYQIKELVDNERKTVTGSFRLGIIPTVASYLVPELLQHLASTKSGIDLILQEIPTTRLIEYVQNGKVDGGLAATPLNHPAIIETPIYYEKFYAYVSPSEPFAADKEVDLGAIDLQKVWLLDNVHCLRGQVMKLCQLKKEGNRKEAVRYESGSLETLINIVDYNGGLTILPEMTAMSLPEDRQSNLRNLHGGMQVREISLIVSQDFVRRRMANEVIELIRHSVPKSMQNSALRQYNIQHTF